MCKLLSGRPQMCLAFVDQESWNRGKSSIGVSIGIHQRGGRIALKLGVDFLTDWQDPRLCGHSSAVGRVMKLHGTWSLKMAVNFVTVSSLVAGLCPRAFASPRASPRAWLGVSLGAPLGVSVAVSATRLAAGGASAARLGATRIRRRSAICGSSGPQVVLLRQCVPRL